MYLVPILQTARRRVKVVLYMNIRLQYNTVVDKFAPTYANAYDHTMLNAPVLVRSTKLSNIGPG